MTKSSRAKEEKRIKVAIIGSGLAGLSAGFLLSQTARIREKYEIHIFERNESLGLDASSISVSNPKQKQKQIRIDVPMRSINAGYYPNLTRLYKTLGIKLKRTDFTFSFSSIHTPRSPFMLYNGQSGIRGFSIKQNHSILSSIEQNISLKFKQSITTLTFAFSYLVLLFFALYHHACGHLLDPKHSINREPFLHWSNRHKRFINSTFIHSIVLTIFSAVTTSSIASVEQIPAAEILLYISSTLFRNHYTVQGGVQTVQDALTRNIPIEHIHTSCTVEQIRAEKQGYTISIRDQSSMSNFHHVILATPATFSKSLIESYCNSLDRHSLHYIQLDRIRTLQDNLAQIRYEESMVINHSDRLLLPNDKNDWRDLNLVSANVIEQDERFQFLASKKHGGRSAMATHIIQEDSKIDGNDDDHHHRGLILQTTNPTIWPKKETIISSSNFVRALTPISKEAIDGLFEWKSFNLTFQERLMQTLKLFIDFQWLSKNDDDHSSFTSIHSDWLTNCFSIVNGKKHSLRLGKSQFNRSLHPFDLHSTGNIWLCGSYAQGIPLLEGCVTSSILVVNEILQQSTPIS